MTEPPVPASPWQIFTVFLKLGLTSFGGPIAHLGFFQQEFVERRRWLSADAYAELVALCQFMPGPASSQVGFAIGLQRAGLPGALAAWLGFTLPSALIMIACGAWLVALDPASYAGAVQGLKLAAVAVVAWALWGMARSLAPDWQRRVIVIIAALAALLLGGVGGQLLALAIGALLAVWLVPPQPAMAAQAAPPSLGRRPALLALTLFATLLLVLPLLALQLGGTDWCIADAMYRAGALVFGGGHVVLPLLHAETVTTGLISEDHFLAGYGIAQALPGPLFAFGSLIGTSAGGIGTGLLATLMIFLPGCLLILAALPFWQRLRGNPRLRRHVAGINAAVVGLLAAALWDPVLTQAIHHWHDLPAALLVLALLASGRVPVWLLVSLAGLVGWLTGSPGPL